MQLQTLQDIPSLKGKKVIVRVDFNVPLDENGNVANDDRIKFALPTLEYLLAHGVSQIIVMFHVGRPKNNESHLKADKVAAKLADLIGMDVTKVDDWGENGIPDAKIVALENLRFHPGEKSKDGAQRDEFGEHLASLADLYVNDAFSNSHRNHASMTSVPKIIPGYVGIETEKEVATISQALENPERPVVAVVAGIKADKLTAISNILKFADNVLIGGALAYALKATQGYSIGNTKVDREGMEEMADLAEKISSNDKVLLPDDAVVTTELSEKAESKVVPIDGIEDGWMAVDTGPATIQKYSDVIQGAKTVLWFGPVGVFEIKAFSNGTKSIGEAIAKTDALKIVGGGDSAMAVKKFDLTDKMSHVSTGGGASLTMIEGKPLPAIEILKR